jgi:hypothetical protein
MSLTKQPFQNEVRCLDRWPKARGYSKFDERDETPMRTSPFLVGMDPETAISPLAREKSLDNWSVRNLFLGRQNFFRIFRSVKDLCESEITNRRIA